MALGEFLSRIGTGRGPETTPTEETERSGTPGSDALARALDATSQLVTGGDVPSPVTARVLRVVGAVRDTLPRLSSLGTGSATAYNVMATATDYLPDAVNGYLRLPRRFADTRPIDGGRTSLMVLVDQLDLLGATMDRVFDAIYRDDANALVAHGAFLEEKFGRTSTGGALGIGAGETPLPQQPAPEAGGVPGGEESAHAPQALDQPGESEPVSPQAVESDPPRLQPPRSTLDL